MMTISQTIVDFVHKSVQIGDLDSVDIIYIHKTNYLTY